MKVFLVHSCGQLEINFLIFMKVCESVVIAPPQTASQTFSSPTDSQDPKP